MRRTSRAALSAAIVAVATSCNDLAPPTAVGSGPPAPRASVTDVSCTFAAPGNFCGIDVGITPFIPKPGVDGSIWYDVGTGGAGAVDVTFSRPVDRVRAIGSGAGWPDHFVQAYDSAGVLLGTAYMKRASTDTVVITVPRIARARFVTSAADPGFAWSGSSFTEAVSPPLCTVEMSVPYPGTFCDVKIGVAPYATDPYFWAPAIWQARADPSVQRVTLTFSRAVGRVQIEDYGSGQGTHRMQAYDSLGALLGTALYAPGPVSGLDLIVPGIRRVDVTRSATDPFGTLGDLAFRATNIPESCDSPTDRCEIHHPGQYSGLDVRITPYATNLANRVDGFWFTAADPSVNAVTIDLSQDVATFEAVGVSARNHAQRLDAYDAGGRLLMSTYPDDVPSVVALVAIVPGIRRVVLRTDGSDPAFAWQQPTFQRTIGSVPCDTICLVAYPRRYGGTDVTLSHWAPRDLNSPALWQVGADTAVSRVTMRFSTGVDNPSILTANATMPGHRVEAYDVNGVLLASADVPYSTTTTGDTNRVRLSALRVRRLDLVNNVNDRGFYWLRAIYHPLPATAASISGPTSISLPGTYTWAAAGTGGDGSYTYAWRRYDAATGLWTTLGSLPSQNVTFGAGTSGSLTLEATVSSNGSSAKVATTVSLAIPPAPSARISGPITITRIGTYTWAANANGGNGAFTYQWYTRPYGTVAWTKLGTAPSQSRTVGSGGGFELRVDVTSAGMSGSDATYVDVQLPTCGVSRYCVQ